jgi:hypothetical protein
VHRQLFIAVTSWVDVFDTGREKDRFTWFCCLFRLRKHISDSAAENLEALRTGWMLMREDYMFANEGLADIFYFKITPACLRWHFHKQRSLTCNRILNPYI